MTDPELAVLAGAITTGGGAILAIARWAVGLWAQVRREDIEATRETAAAQRLDAQRSDEAQRADGARIREALVEQAKSNAAVIGTIGKLMIKIDTLIEWRERTPPPDETPSERRRRNARTKLDGD